MFAETRCGSADAGRGAIEHRGGTRLPDRSQPGCRTSSISSLLITCTLLITSPRRRTGRTGHIRRIQPFEPVLALCPSASISPTSVNRSAALADRAAGVRNRASSTHSGRPMTSHSPRHSWSDSEPTVM